MWDLILLVPDHSLCFYLLRIISSSDLPVVLRGEIGLKFEKSEGSFLLCHSCYGWELHWLVSISLEE